MVIPFLTVYLTGRGYTLTQAGLVMAAFGVGSIFGSFLGGKLTDRFGFFWVQVVSLLLNGVLFIVLAYMNTLLQISICIFTLSSLGEAFRPANAAAIAFYSNDSNRTRCYSLNRLAINLGWAIGPAIGGILASINYMKQRLPARRRISAPSAMGRAQAGCAATSGRSTSRFQSSECFTSSVACSA